MLRIQLEVARIEADLSKTLASLERAVGVELNGRPTEPAEPRRSAGPTGPVNHRARPCKGRAKLRPLRPLTDAVIGSRCVICYRETWPTRLEAAAGRSRSPTPVLAGRLLTPRNEMT